MLWDPAILMDKCQINNKFLKMGGYKEMSQGCGYILS